MADTASRFVHLVASDLAGYSEQKRSHAFHEAGHVVAAHYLGATVIEAALVPDDENPGEPAGYTSYDFPDLPAEFPKIVDAADAWDPLSRMSADPVKDWIARRAGGVAQLVLATLTSTAVNEYELHHDTEQDQAQLEFQLFGMPPDHKPKWEAMRYIETWALLLAAQSQLEHVAQALLINDGHPVSGEQLVQAITTQPGKARPWSLAGPETLNRQAAEDVASSLGYPTWPDPGEYRQSQIAEHLEYLERSGTPLPTVGDPFQASGH